MKFSNFCLLLAGILVSPQWLHAGVAIIAKDAKSLKGSANLIESKKYLTFTEENDGSATYDVVIPKTGLYKMKVSVIARKNHENSMYFSFDDAPKAAFDFAISSSVKVNEYANAINLTAGTHKLVLSAKEPYIKLSKIELSEVSGNAGPAPVPQPSVTPKPTITPKPTATPTPPPAPTPAPTTTPAPTPPPARDPASGSLLSPDASQFGNIDTNAPTIVNASSLADAIAKVKAATPGTRVVLPSGTFSNFAGTIVAAGTAAKPVVLEGQADGSTILNGKIKIYAKGTGLVLRYLTFSEPDSVDYSGDSALIKFDACTQCGLFRSSFVGGPAAAMEGTVDTKRFKSVLIAGSSQKVEIGYNLFKGKKNGGSVILINRLTSRTDWNEGHRIYKNHFLDRELAGNDTNDFDVIRIGDSATSQSPTSDVAEGLMSSRNAMVGNTIEFNLFENISLEKTLAAKCAAANSWDLTECKGEPEIISVKAPQSIVRFNTFLNASGGVTLRHAFQCILEGNYISGKNTDKGINTVVPNSYGLRVIGENHLILNNHIQDVNPVGDLFAGISIVPGQPNAALNGYWPVYESIVAMNFLKDIQGRVISLTAAYGTRSRSILPEKMVISYNLTSGSSTPFINTAGSTGFLNTFSFLQNLSDSSAIGSSPSGTVASAPAITTQSIGRGITAPSNASYVGNSGILVSSSARQESLLNNLGGLASADRVQRMRLLMKFLKLKNGSLYDNSLPLTASDVGPRAK